MRHKTNLSVIAIFFLTLFGCDSGEQDSTVLNISVQPGYISENSATFKLWVIVCTEDDELVDYVKFTESGEYGLKTPPGKYNLHIAYVNKPATEGTRVENIFLNTYRSVSTSSLTFRSNGSSIGNSEVSVNSIPQNTRMQISAPQYSASFTMGGGSFPYSHTVQVPLFETSNSIFISVTPLDYTLPPQFGWFENISIGESLNVYYDQLQPMSSLTLDGEPVNASYSLRGYFEDFSKRHTLILNRPVVNNILYFPENVFSNLQYTISIPKSDYMYSNSFTGTEVFSQPLVDLPADFSVSNPSSQNFACSTTGEYTYAYQNFSYSESGSGFRNFVNWNVVSSSSTQLTYSLPKLPEQILDELQTLKQNELTLYSSGIVLIPEISNYAEYPSLLYAVTPLSFKKIYSKYRTF